MAISDGTLSILNTLPLNNRSETLPFFPLSWVITWCAHDLGDFAKIARIYDFLICFNPLMSVYLTAAVRSREKVNKTLATSITSTNVLNGSFSSITGGHVEKGRAF